MFNYEILILIFGFILILFFSVLAAHADKKLWKKCRRKNSCLLEQQKITMGKSHCR